MKTSISKFMSALLLLVMMLCAGDAVAQSRRPIDSQHPMWLVHIDVWNNADPQKIINLIPDDIKPYVCMNLSLSCSFDKTLGIHTKPQNAMLTYKSWATICQANNMWFTCQPASGGHTHIKDEDLATFEYMFKHYPNFLGWNYAEQFWGFDEGFDTSKGEIANNSSTQSSRIALFAKLVEMHHQYGGFLTISFCGNIWSHGLNPNGMMSRNKNFLEACKKYPEAVLFLYKYTTASCFYNNESVSIAPFISGLATNYGVRYDNCGYNGALDALLGENHGKKYPAAVGIGTVMEQTGINGGAVWDGPELIWTEDFQNLANSQSGDYTRRNWGRFKTFDNIWIDMFRKVIDGTLYIPTREEVIARNKVVIINNQSGDDATKYAAPGDLYDGLYKQTDPFNRNNGQWMDNFLFLKSTGRYQAIPVVLDLYDDLAKSIPTQVKRSNYTTKWSTQTAKRNAFNKLYPKVSDGPLYVARFENELVTYFNHSYMSSVRSEEATIPLEYNTCNELKLNYGLFTSGVVREYTDSITFYLNNYRTDTTTVVANSVTVTGATAKPTYTYKKRGNASVSGVSEAWDEETGTYTLSFKLMGPIDIILHCAGAATDRRDDARAPIALGIPKQPEDVLGDIIIEAEDMDYKNISACVTDQFNSAYRSVRGHSAMGFAVMGTSTSGALRGYVKPKFGGQYNVSVRYTTNGNAAGKIQLKVGSTSRTVTLEKTGVNEWRKATGTFTLTEGKNNAVYVTNTGGKMMYIDNVTLSPVDKVPEKYEIRLQESNHGTLVCEMDSTFEGNEVRIEAIPDEGYAFVAWEVVHGDIKLDDLTSPVATFIMPDDDVELKAIFRDITLVYQLDFSGVLSGNMPQGWRAVQEENNVHAYPGNYSSGARTFAGFNGYQGAALYWRNDCAEYGRQDDYKLTLEPGKYVLRYAMAAWKGTPTYAAEIVAPDGTVLIAGDTYTATPNANGSTMANISTAQSRTLEFTVTEAGDYVIRFANKSTAGGLIEFLLAQCQLNTVIIPDAVEVPATVVAQGQAAVYDLQGRKVGSNGQTGGIYIIRTADGKTYKRLLK